MEPLLYVRKVSVVSYFFLKEGENAHTNFAMLTLFCPEFKNKCVLAGVGVGVGERGLFLVKGLFGNIVLIELGVAKLLRVCLNMGWVFVKCALETKQNLGVSAFVSCLQFRNQKDTLLFKSSLKC